MGQAEVILDIVDKPPVTPAAIGYSNGMYETLARNRLKRLGGRGGSRSWEDEAGRRRDAPARSGTAGLGVCRAEDLTGSAGQRFTGG